MQAGKTIAARRERPEADSERERVRRVMRKRRVAAVFGVILLAGLLGFLAVKAFQEWVKWASERREVTIIEQEPSVEVIDDRTGKRAELTSRVKTYIVNLEEEFVLKEMKITRVRVPADKIRELDVEIEGFSGAVKVSLDRNPAVTAEDARKMVDYLRGQGVEGCEYIDIRVERKGYWK